MTTYEDPAERIDALVARFEPRFATWFRDAVAAMVAAAGSVDLVELMLQRGMAESTVLLAGERAALRGAGVWADAFTTSGEAAAAFVGDAIDVQVTFDGVNERAVAAIRARRFELVRQVTDDQRATIRAALVEGTQRSMNPRDQARLFRDSIGLTDRQLRAVANYRRLLERGSADALQRALRDRRFDRTVERAVRTGEPLTPEQVDRMVGRYRERYVKYRSEVIARTAALDAVHQGTEELYAQATEDGTLVADELVRQWNTSADGRERSWHRSMHRQQRGLREPFISGQGNRLRRPGDPSAPGSERIQCRCRISTRFANGA